MRGIEHPEISMALTTGYPSNDYSEYETHVEDHPTEDEMGSEIKPGDRYFVINEGDKLGEVVLLEDNVEDFLIERLEAKAYTAK